MTDIARDEALDRAVALRDRGEPERARAELLALAARLPHDARVAYQTAWTHDVLGLEAEAVPFYERALAGAELTDDERRGALLGLGSTLRVLGRTAEAVAVLERGTADFPGDGGLRVFLALARFAAGDGPAAMRLLLDLLAATSDDPSVRRYRRAILAYAAELDPSAGR